MLTMVACNSLVTPQVPTEEYPVVDSESSYPATEKHILENKDNLTLIYDWVSKNLIKSMSIKNFRSIMYSFLDSGIIDINKYFKMTDSFYIHSLFLNNGEFFGASGQNLIKFTKMYSQAKYGSYKDIEFFSNIFSVHDKNR